METWQISAAHNTNSGIRMCVSINSTWTRCRQLRDDQLDPGLDGEPAPPIRQHLDSLFPGVVGSAAGRRRRVVASQRRGGEESLDQSQFGTVLLFLAA